MPARSTRLLCTAVIAAALAVLPALVRADDCSDQCAGLVQQCVSDCSQQRDACTASANAGQCVDPASCSDPQTQQGCDDGYGTCTDYCQSWSTGCAQECSTPAS